MLLNGQKDRGSVLDGAAVAEPGGQRDAAGGLRRQVGEIEDDQSKASAFEQQIGGAEDLLQTVLRVARGFFSNHILLPPGAIEVESGLRGLSHFSRKRRARNGAPWLSLFAAANPEQAVEFYTSGE